MEHDKWNDRLEIEGDRDEYCRGCGMDSIDCECDEVEPIGNCPKCGTPIYCVEGFCGVCEPHKL